MNLTEKIFSNGCLLHFRVSRWACHTKLTHEDLGLYKEDLPKNFELGAKLFLPRKIKNLLNTYATRMKYIYARYGLPFFIHNTKFITNEAIEDFFKDIQPLLDKYYILKKDIIENYTTYKFESRREFLSAAKDAYNLYRKVEPNPINETTFINNYIDKISNYYPSTEEIDETLQIKYVFFRFSSPTDIPPTYSSLILDNLDNDLKKFIENSVIFLRGLLKSYLYKFLDPLDPTKILPPEAIYKKLRRRGIRSDIEAVFKLNFFKDSIIETVKYFYQDFLLAHKPRDFFNSILKFNLENRIKIFITGLADPVSAKKTIENYLS